MPTDTKADARDFLRQHVDPTNISVPIATDEDIVIADYERGPNYPEVSIVTDDPVVIGGGETGYSAMDAQGGGPVQEGYSVILVDCWGGKESTDIYQTEGSHPDTVATELGAEVAAAIRDNAEGPSGYRWAGATPPRGANVTEGGTETEYRSQVFVRLGYQD